MIGQHVLQAMQFFAERAQARQSHSHNGRSAEDVARHPDEDDTVREIDAHRNVFHRP